MGKEKLSREETSNILAQATLGRHDIESLEHVGRDRALKIMRVCKASFGGKPLNPSRITTESYLRYCGYPEGSWANMLRKDN